MRRFLPILLILCVACNKPDPNPELKDGIYQDMQAQLEVTEKSIAEAKKQVEENEKTLEAAKPQSGTIRYAKKRVWDSEKVVERLEQQKKYWQIRLPQRRDYVRRQSMIAFKTGKPWDDSAEWEQYQTEKRLRLAKLTWDNKERRQQFLKESGLGGKKKEGGEKAEGGEKKEE